MNLTFYHTKRNMFLTFYSLNKSNLFIYATHITINCIYAFLTGLHPPPSKCLMSSADFLGIKHYKWEVWLCVASYLALSYLYDHASMYNSDWLVAGFTWLVIG